MVVEKHSDASNLDIQSALVITTKDQGGIFIVSKLSDRTFILNKISNLLSQYQEINISNDDLPPIS
jgi:hypothetical protein